MDRLGCPHNMNIPPQFMSITVDRPENTFCSSLVSGAPLPWPVAAGRNFSILIIDDQYPLETHVHHGQHVGADIRIGPHWFQACFPALPPGSIRFPL